MALLATSALLLLVRCLPTLATDPPYPVRTEEACGDGVVDLGDGGEQCDSLDGAVGCLKTCRIDCAGGAFDELTGTCYLPRGVANSFREAVERCERSGAHLVTYGSERERAFVAERLKPGRSWLGLSFDPKLLGFASVTTFEPGWSASCSGCYAPNALDAAEPCVEQSDGGAWVTRAAASETEALDVVCERERPGRSSEGCSNGVCIHRFQDKSYLLAFDRASADDAVKNCAALGGRLVMPDTEEERAYLARELRAMLVELDLDRGVWIGLSKSEGEWRWGDDAGLLARPNPWGEREPQLFEDGGGVRAYADLTEGRLDVQLARVANADERRPYVCEFR